MRIAIIFLLIVVISAIMSALFYYLTFYVYNNKELEKQDKFFIATVLCLTILFIALVACIVYVVKTGFAF